MIRMGFELWHDHVNKITILELGQSKKQGNVYDRLRMENGVRAESSSSTRCGVPRSSGGQLDGFRFLKPAPD